MKNIAENLNLITSNFDDTLWRTIPDGFQKSSLDFHIMYTHLLFMRIDSVINTQVKLDLLYRIFRNY